MLVQEQLKKNRKLILILFLLTGLISLGLWLWGGGWQESWGKPLVMSFNVSQGLPSAERDVSDPTLDIINQLKDKIGKATGKYSIFVYRLSDNTGWGINEDTVMPAVSIMKVPIMTATYKAVEDGTLKIDDIYVLKDADKESGSGPLEFLDEGTPISVKTLLEVTGKQSDNTAPVVMVNMIGADAVKKVITDLGMKNTDFDGNTTTALDMGRMWANLYRGAVVGTEGRDYLWADLQDSIYEDRIPAGVPAGTTVIHKVGTGDNIWADAGIVTLPSGKPFILVILDQDIDPNEAGTLVPQLTKMVWDYETKRGV